jgi:hypothetical protein
MQSGSPSVTSASCYRLESREQHVPNQAIAGFFRHETSRPADGRVLTHLAMKSIRGDARLKPGPRRLAFGTRDGEGAPGLPSRLAVTLPRSLPVRAPRADAMRVTDRRRVLVCPTCSHLGKRPIPPGDVVAPSGRSGLLRRVAVPLRGEAVPSLRPPSTTGETRARRDQEELERGRLRSEVGPLAKGRAFARPADLRLRTSRATTLEVSLAPGHPGLSEIP